MRHPRPVVDGADALDPCDHANGIVILEVFTDAGQIVDHRRADIRQQRRRTDAGDLQQPRRVDRTGRDDHLAPGLDALPAAVAAAVQVADAGGAPAVEGDRRRPGVGPEIDPAGPHRRVQEGPGRADPAGPEDRALIIADTGLVFSVVIAVQRNAEAGDAVDERFAERVTPIDIGHPERAVAAAKCVVSVADPAFAPHEIWQDIAIAPAAIAALRPAVVIHLLAAIVDQAVDRARAAEGAALNGPDRPAAGPFRRLGLERPGPGRVVDGFDESGRNMQVRVAVRRSGLEHANLGLAVFRQPPGQHRSGRAGADNHVIEGIASHISA